ncbi:MAG: sirohydrochlorin cobaltochelatase [Eggerthellaceae bacterium]
MPRLEFSDRFATDLADVESDRVFDLIMECLSNIERFGEFGSRNIPRSIKQKFGENVRKAAVNPFDLVYTYYDECNVVRVEALVLQRQAR